MGVFSLLKQQQKPLAVIWCFVFCFYSLAHATKNHKFDKISPCNFVNTNVSNPTWFYVATSAQTSKSFVLWTTKTPLKMLSQIDHKGFFLTVLWLNSKWLLTNRIWRRRGELVYISIHITYIYIFFSLNMYKLFLVLIPSLILLLLLEPEQWKLLRFDFRFKNSKYSKSSLVINSIFLNLSIR